MNGVQKGGNSNVAVEKPGRNLINQEIKENIVRDVCRDLLYLCGSDKESISPFCALPQNSYSQSNNAKTSDKLKSGNILQNTRAETTCQRRSVRYSH